MKRKKQIKALPLYLIRILQISGISLITAGVLNLIFLKFVIWLFDVLLLLSGFTLLWISYRLWFFTQKRFSAIAKLK